ncbi:MAG: ABC transporter permease subunit, partial [Chthoniobacteraceae bacterium]
MSSGAVGFPFAACDSVPQGCGQQISFLAPMGATMIPPMRRFCVQLSWEFRKLAARRRTCLAPVACLGFQLCLSLFLRLPSVRAKIAAEYWRHQLEFADYFTGLTTAAYLLGNTMTFVGCLFVALITTDIVGQEIEEGTMRTLLTRPVRRNAVLLQKLIVAAAFAVGLSVFIGTSGLCLGLLIEGRGPLLMIGVK